MCQLPETGMRDKVSAYARSDDLESLTMPHNYRLTATDSGPH